MSISFVFVNEHGASYDVQNFDTENMSFFIYERKCLFAHSVCANFSLNAHSVCANFGLIAHSPVYSVILLK